MAEAYIYDCVRTPRGKGKKNGALHEVTPTELLAQMLKAIQQRNNLDTSLVEDVVIGCVTPIGDQGGNIAKRKGRSGYRTGHPDRNRWRTRTDLRQHEHHGGQRHRIAVAGRLAGRADGNH